MENVLMIIVNNQMGINAIVALMVIELTKILAYANYMMLIVK